MTELFFLLFITLIGNTYGYNLELLPNPSNEDSDFGDICHDPNATINFSGLHLSRLEENFISSPIITCLDLQNNGVEYIHSEAFNNLPNLKYLNLAANSFELESIFSNNFMNLETLILDNNRGKMSADWSPLSGEINKRKIHFQNVYRKLKKLFIRNTYGLEIIGAGLNIYFPSLSHVYLSGSAISMNEFSWLPNSLKYLDLSGHSLPSLTLNNLTKLKWIFLDNPSEKRLSTIYFENLVSLNYLSVPSNNINQITSSTFINVSSLVFLDLFDNNIEYIEGGSFDSMTNLRFLNLSNNNIGIIQGGTVDHLINLKILALDKNLISAFPVIANEMKLEVLTLNCNRLKSIIGGTFIKMPYLTSLFLHDNEITYIDQQAFAGLNNLKVLTLSNNMLVSLPFNWMLPMTGLQVLDISGNHIRDFKQLGFSDSSPVKNIYLSNQLEFIKSSALENIPENVTISLKSNYTSIEKCSKSKNKYSQRYG